MQLLIKEVLIKKSSVLGNSVTFSPNLSKFSWRDGMGGGEGVGGVGVTFLTNLSEMSSFFEEDCKICQLRIMKTLMNQN